MKSKRRLSTCHIAYKGPVILGAVYGSIRRQLIHEGNRLMRVKYNMVEERKKDL